MTTWRVNPIRSQTQEPCEAGPGSEVAPSRSGEAPSLRTASVSRPALSRDLTGVRTWVESERRFVHLSPPQS